MIFMFLITIVFIAELIITFTILFQLFRFDKVIRETDDFLNKAKPQITSIAELVHGISDQIAELAPIWVKKIMDKRDEIILNQLKRLMSAILFWSINIKVIRKLSKSKFAKAAWKGLSLLQSVI